MLTMEKTARDSSDGDAADNFPMQMAGDAERPPIYSSAELLQGRREVWIEHGDQMYRLRLTQAGKLYLTK